MISQSNDFVDLKSFFSSNSLTGSGLGPSTHESVNDVVSEEGEVQGVAVELGDVEAQVIVENAQLPGQDVEGIRNFIPDVHLISDPGLRIPIEGFFS